jgi:glycine cleavage system transcriptional repressor
MKPKEKHYLVITAIGADRVGFADELTKEILSHNGNIEESKMAVLGGEFASLVLVSSEDPKAIAGLVDALPSFGKEREISIFLKKTTPPHSREERIAFRLETVSLDTPGIVHAVTSILKRYDISIEDLETDTASAPMTGARIFHMRAIVTIPERVSPRKIKEEFEELESIQSLEITLHPLSVSTE